MRGARPERALDAVVRRALRPASGVRVCVALSGGPDSVALAALLDRLAREDGGDVVLAPRQPTAYARAPGRTSASRWSVGARLSRRVLVARLQPAASDEAALRDARYAALARLAREVDATSWRRRTPPRTQTETVLLALFRGSGLDGWPGWRRDVPSPDGIELVRPLLRVTRAELATELRHSGPALRARSENETRATGATRCRAHLAALRDDFPNLDRGGRAGCGEIVRGELGETRALQAAFVPCGAQLSEQGALRDGLVSPRRSRAGRDARASVNSGAGLSPPARSKAPAMQQTLPPGIERPSTGSG